MSNEKGSFEWRERPPISAFSETTGTPSQARRSSPALPAGLHWSTLPAPALCDAFLAKLNTYTKDYRPTTEVPSSVSAGSDAIGKEVPTATVSSAATKPGVTPAALGVVKEMRLPPATRARATLDVSSAASLSASRASPIVFPPPYIRRMMHAFGCMSPAQKRVIYNFNPHITGVLNALIEEYEAKLMPHDEFRARTTKTACEFFRRLPLRIASIEQLDALLNSMPDGVLYGASIGESTYEKLCQLLRKGSVDKLEGRLSSSNTACKDLVRLFGIGPTKSKLLASPPHNIRGLDHLREVCGRGAVPLHRGRPIVDPESLVCLSCYEDLVTRIPRVEVTQIVEFVVQAASRVYGAGAVEAICCGSYRRGKATSGDVDILVTTRPDSGIAESTTLPLQPLLDDLSKSGFMVHILRGETNPDYGKKQGARGRPEKGHGHGASYRPGARNHKTGGGGHHGSDDSDSGAEGGDRGDFQRTIQVASDSAGAKRSRAAFEGGSSSGGGGVMRAQAPVPTWVSRPLPARLFYRNGTVRRHAQESAREGRANADTESERDDAAGNTVLTWQQLTTAQLVPTATAAPASGMGASSSGRATAAAPQAGEGAEGSTWRRARHAPAQALPLFSADPPDYTKVEWLPQKEYDHEMCMGLCRLGGAGSRIRRIDIKSYPRAIFPFAVQYFTGSDFFNRSLRLYVNKCGWTLSDQGLRPALRERGAKVWDGFSIRCASEADLFVACGVPWREPHERDMEEEEIDVEPGQEPYKLVPQPPAAAQQPAPIPLHAASAIGGASGGTGLRAAAATDVDFGEVGMEGSEVMDNLVEVLYVEVGSEDEGDLP